MSVLHNHNHNNMMHMSGQNQEQGVTHKKNKNSLALTRPYSGTNERSCFRAAKELCRFVMTTIVVANASKCTANAASIIANYHRTAAARSSRKSTEGSFHLPSKVGVEVGVKENNINLWHFRTFSTCSAGSPFEANDVESVFTSSGRRTRKASDVTSSRAVNAVNSNANHANVNRGASAGASNSASANASTEEYYDTDDPRNLEEMRAQLGPVGLLVANAVEVGVTTASSYISGGLFGYFIGGAMGSPGLLRKSAEVGGSGPAQMKSAAPNAGMKEIQRRIGDWNSKALIQGKSWGAMSASFSGFHALTRVCRGGVEDRWNSIIGSAATGAYLSRQGS